MEDDKLALQGDRWSKSLLDESRNHFNRQPNALLVDCIECFHCGSPGSALDVNMGQGRNAIFLAKKGWKVTGVDIAEKALEYARVEAQQIGHKITTHMCDINTYNFGKSLYDLIVVSYADESTHVDNVREALKPGGLVVFENFHSDINDTLPTGKLEKPIGFDTNVVKDAYIQAGFTILRYDDKSIENADFSKYMNHRLVKLIARKGREGKEKDDSFRALPMLPLDDPRAGPKRKFTRFTQNVQAKGKPLNPLSTAKGDPSSNTLKHMSYSCPGLSGPDVRMCIEPRSFDAYLSCPYPIVIPIFQRRYCWPEVQLRGWWRDACQGLGRTTSAHTTGKTSFKMLDDEASGSTSDGEMVSKQLLCIDGQQRSTSMCLLLVAIRDELLSILRSATTTDDSIISQIKSCVQYIQSKLFLDTAACETWANTWVATTYSTTSTNDENAWDKVHKEGGRLDTLFTGGARLRPSYVDRKAFYELLTHGVVVNACWQQQLQRKCERIVSLPALTETTLQSPQGLAKTIFDSCAKQVERDADFNTRVSSLISAVRKATHHMNIMYCEVLTPINLSQVFLWMQEKSLFGMGALLKNDNPGIPFTCGDLARNLLLSPFVMQDDVSHSQDKSTTSGAISRSELQDRMYEEKWILPLAAPAERLQGGLDAQVTAFVDALDANTHSHHRALGSMEQQLLAMKDQMPPALEQKFGAVLQKGAPLRTYARLHGHVEEIQYAKTASTGAGYEEINVHFEALKVVLQQLVDFVSMASADNSVHT